MCHRCDEDQQLITSLQLALTGEHILSEDEIRSLIYILQNEVDKMKDFEAELKYR